MHLSTMENMLIQRLLQGGLNPLYLFKNIDTQAGLDLQIKLLFTK